MSKNRDIFVIIGTTVGIMFALPVLDRVADLVNSSINKTINQWQLDMRLAERETEAAAETISPSPSITQAVGFQIPNEEETDYE